MLCNIYKFTEIVLKSKPRLSLLFSRKRFIEFRWLKHIVFIILRRLIALAIQLLLTVTRSSTATARLISVVRNKCEKEKCV